MPPTTWQTEILAPGDLGGRCRASGEGAGLATRHKAQILRGRRSADVHMDYRHPRGSGGPGAEAETLAALDSRFRWNDG